MSTNMLKKRLQAGKACVNAWLAIPSGFSAETMAQCGWDSVTVDMQHGVQDYQSMVACFQAMDKHPVTPLVRVPWNEPGIIGKVLDGGAWGVICPMVNTPPRPRRWSPMPLSAEGQAQQRPDPRRRLWRGDALPATANDEVLVIPMIETQEAIDNIDAILDVPGISGIYIGPSDLGLSLGLEPKLDREEPQVLKIYEKLTGRLQEAQPVRRHPQRHGGYAAKDDRHGLPLRHDHQRLAA